jgi:tRNA(Ile)-lysidine synthase
MRNSLPALVNQALVEQRLLAGGEKVLVALSGGADSVALLLVLGDLASRWSITLHAFHLNHQLRGREADGDERFVQRLCRKLGVPCTTVRADVRGYSRKHKVPLEEAGRNLRYALLEQSADNLGCQKIAIAHNADDNAETMLMNLIRGAGLNGLSGMPVARGRLIRPLLGIERIAIERYLKLRGTAWRRDSSNTQIEFRRNLIRHKLMPILAEINPQVTAALNRTARLLKDDDAGLDEQARKIAKLIADREPGGYRIDFAQLLKYNISLRRRIVKMLMPELDFETIESVLQVAAGPTGKTKSLTRGRIARREHDGLYLGVASQDSALGVATGRALNVPGRTQFPELGLEVETQVGNGTHHRNNGSVAEHFDLTALRLPLSIRPRQPGDRMVPFGGRDKKLKEILINDKIPRRRRDRLPVLCDQEGILWVVGSRRSDRARVDDDTRSILTVSVTPA